MRTCPRCGKNYPDSEKFCELDGTALVEGAAGGRVTTNIERDPRGEAGPEQPIECPVCGGKAEPGEVICNFCGTRLVAPEAPAASAGTFVNPETFAPSQDRIKPEQFSGEPPAAEEESSAGRRLLAVVGYSLAAAGALAAGAWLALHLSRPAAPSRTAAVSPPAASAPLVALAKTMAVQVTGASAFSPERNTTAARKVFEDNKKTLSDLYERALAGDKTLHDGVVVRLRVLPSGEIGSAAVRTSTAPNPALDAEVVNALMGWRFGPSSGGEVEADYPIVFARNTAEAADIESALSTKLASLNAAEAPEYASAPAPPAPAPKTAEAVATPTPPPLEEAIAKPKPEMPAIARKHAPRRSIRRELASIPKPKPSLLERVQARLRAERKFSGVKAYTAHGTVTIYGRVYDDRDKLLAERAVRSVDGVTNVVNTLNSDTSIWAQQQARISQELQNAGFSKVTVKVIGHDAYLNGEVPTELDRERAVTIAEGAAPVKVRTNLIRVAPGNVFGF